MMLARIIQFLIGAAFSAGGGYLAWMHRAQLDQLFPPGPQGLPLMLVGGIGALSLGIVFLVASIAPRPKRTARLQEAAARRAETLRAADAYYAERSRAADRDWRSGKLPSHTPAPAPPADPLFDQEPVREEAPESHPDPLFDPAPAKMEAPESKFEPLFDPPRAFEPEPARAPASEPALRSPAQEPTARPAASKPVATSVPPTPMVFPSTSTLSPIPKSSDLPPQPMAPPASAPAGPSASLQAAPPAAATAPAGVEEADAGFADIRAAIADGRLEDADRLLNASRETATGLALAELTGLAGDHAAAAGRLSNAKWLWRLALKRFGEAGAIDTPAARKVSDRLRLAGQ
jgi:hypothetical protein